MYRLILMALLIPCLLFAGGTQIWAPFFTVGGVLKADSLAVRALNLTSSADIASLTINSAYTFPTADGSAGQLLQTDGANTIGWTTYTAGSDVLWLRNVGSGYVYPNTLTDKVGINTNSPSTELDVNGTVTTSTLITPWQQIKTVAKAGGDYTTITAAIAAITDATTSKRYIINIAPGTYVENITLKDYISLRGSGTGVTVITGTMTFVGNNNISKLNCLTLNISTGDVVTVDNVYFAATGDYLIFQSGGNCTITNSISVMNTLNGAITVTDGILTVKNSILDGAKGRISGDSYIDFQHVNMSTYEGGSYSYIIENSTEVHFNHVYWVQKDNDGSLTKYTSPFMKGFVAENTVRVYMNDTYTEVPLTVADSAHIYVDGYVAKYTGRFDASTGTSTKEALIRARNFYLHMDYGFQGGSHCLEVGFTSDSATFDLADGVIEYMGDQGDAPMAGNLSAGGGTQRWKNITFIDYGSDLNAAVSDLYSTCMCYGNANTKAISCTFISKGTQVMTPSLPYGIFNISFGLDTAPSRHDLLDCNFFLESGFDNRYAFYMAEGVSSKLNNQDTLNVDVKYFGGNGLLSGYYWNGRPAMYNRFWSNNMKHFPVDVHTPDSLIIEQQWNGYTPPKKFAIRDEILSTQLDVEFGNDFKYYSKQNLKLPGYWFQGESTVDVHNSTGAPANYPNGYIVANGNAELDLFDLTRDLWFIYLPNDDGSYITYQIDDVNSKEDTLKVHSNTPVTTEYTDSDYYWKRNGASYGGGCYCIENTDTLFVTFDMGYNRASHEPIYLDFLLSIGVYSQQSHSASLYRVKIGNLYSTQTIHYNVTADTLFLSPDSYYRHNPTEIKVIPYEDNNDKRYLKVAFCDVPGVYGTMSMTFITALGVKDVRVTKHKDRY